MIFENPRMLWLMAVTLPLLAWFLWWAWRKKQALIRQFVQSRLLAELTVGVSARVQKARLVLLAIAVALLFLTLARPQWGFAWEEARQRGIDVVVAIDTSRSMLAEDIPPNRITRAKLAAVDLMRLAKSDRLGLVAFAGTAFLQCPLTLDEEAFRQSVETLDVGIIPEGGTSLTQAIEAAWKAFKDEDNHKVLVLFTDGEDHEQGAVQAAERAATAGLRIFTIGVGTPHGELLRQRDENGAMVYIKDPDGNVVKSRLNETLLTEIATVGNGFYLPMSGANTIDILYERGLAQLPKTEISSRLIRRYKERYYWPLSIAIVVLLLELFLVERRRVQRSEAIVAASNAELRKMVAVVVAGIFLSGSPAVASSASALKKYEAGQFEEAFEDFQRLLEKKPGDARLHYNAGAAAYQNQSFGEAAKHFSAALASPEPNLRERAHYNLGNSFFRLGEQHSDPGKKAGHWEQAIRQYEAALKIDPKDADAQFNLEWVKKKLDELKQQQQEQQKDDPQSQPPTENEKDSGEKEQKENPPNANPKDQQKPSEDQSKQDPPQQNKENQDKRNAKENEQQKQESRSSQQNQKDQQPESKPQPKPGGESDEKQSQSAQGDAAPQTAEGRMTPEQIERLLDAQKSKEKALIFIPRDKPSGRKPIRKDW